MVLSGVIGKSPWRWLVKPGDLVRPWSRIDDGAIGIIIKILSDQWSDRCLILTEFELLNIPRHQIEVISETR